MNEVTLTNELLSRAVAEIVGWRITLEYDDNDNFMMLETIYTPDRKVASYSNIMGNTLDAVWIYEMESGDYIPNYATDANAALTLTVEGYWLAIESPFGQRHEWLASYNAMRSDNDEFYGEGATPAEAICKARLALAEYLATKEATK